MKTFINKYTYFLSGILLLTSCFSDTVKPDLLQDYTSKMVVNAVWSNNSGISLELTTSKGSIDSTLPTIVKDAIVEYTSTAGTGSLSYNIGSEEYEDASSFSAGTSVNVSIKHPTYPNISSLIRFPDATEAFGVLDEEGGLDTAGNLADKLSVSFKDIISENNYYKINLYYFNETIMDWVPLIVPKTDPALAEYNSFTLNDAGVLFSDELFNGKVKTITMNVNTAFTAGNADEQYRVTLSSISEDFFLYYRSLQRAQDAKAINFRGGYNNAVVIHSNIDGGLGIIGAETRNELFLK